jgi:hypothetical protein
MADTTYTSLSEMDEAIMKIIGNYRTKALEAMEKGAEEGANLFIKEAQKVSPPFEGTSKGSPRYRDCWAIKNRPKAKYVRSVGNSKKVKGKDNTNIPLINILEFSTVRGRPHVAKAVQNSAGQILELFQSKLES